MTYLIISLVALGIGPLIVLGAGRARSASVLVDAYVLVVVAGLVGLHILPESIVLGGWAAVGAALVGCVLPILAERGMRPARGTRGIVIVLALAGLAAHAMIDGAALAGVDIGLHGGHDHGHHHHHDHAHDHSHDHGSVMALAVIAHRVPVGIGIWWIVGRTLGIGIAIVTLLVTMIGTVVGFAVGEQVLTNASTTGIGIFQALLAGSLLHVLLHAHVPAPTDSASRWRHFASVLGGLAAIATVWVIEASHSHSHGSGPGPAQVFMTLALESAPILLLAYLVAGFAHAFTPGRWIEKINSGGTVGQAVRGIAVGLPLPVCSCGVVPIYRGLVARGTAIAAAVGFLIATPELEIAAVFITFELMGSEIAFARLAAAALLALIVGVVIGVVAKRHSSSADPAELPVDDLSGRPLGERVRGALRTGLVDMVDQTSPWILLGLGASAILMPYLEPEAIAGLPAGVDVPLAALLGMPIYVCASGSTPLAAIFVAQGLSPGAALAFLLTGPATNVTTFGVLKDLHGARTATVFSVAMFVGAIVLGYGVNWLFPVSTVPIANALEHEHGGVFSYVALVVFGVLVLGSLLRRGTRGYLESLFKTPHHGKHDHDEAEHGCCH